MKKIISIIAVLLIVAVFTSGCGSNRGTTANSQRSTETVASEMPTIEPEPTDVVDDPTGQPTTNLTSQITSADLEPYFGEGDAALFVIAENNKAPADGEKPYMSFAVVGLWRDGAVWCDYSHISEPEASYQGNLLQSLILYGHSRRIGLEGWGGEYQVVNGKIVYTVSDEYRDEGKIDKTFQLNNSGELHSSEGGIYQYVGYLTVTGAEKTGVRITFSDDFVLED